MSIALVIKGWLSPEMQKAKQRRYHRDYMRNRLDLKERDLARKNKRYKEDEAYREARKAAEQKRRAAMTPEQRAAELQRRKERTAQLPDEEYERRRILANERSRKSRAKRRERERAENQENTERAAANMAGAADR